MITIDLLKNHPEAIPKLAEIWYEVLGKIWYTDASIAAAIQRYSNPLNDSILPITYVALDTNKPIAMCTLRETEGICLDLKPWLGSLVVHPEYQNKGIGKILITTIKSQAQKMGFEKLYLSALDPNLHSYYTNLGWKIIGTDEYKGNKVNVMEISL